jgi:hypothetical protein
LYANCESVNQLGDTPKHVGTESVFRLPCGETRQSIDQLAHVQEAPNGMEPSRSPAIASRKNGDYQRATGPVIPGNVDIGRFSVVLLENAGGSDEQFCNGIEESLYKQAGPGRLDEVNIMDNRNGRAYGMISGGAVFGSYHGCVYQPKQETLWLYGWSSVVGRLEPQPPDVETLEIQTERN